MEHHPFKSPGIMIYYGAFECLETIVYFERKKLRLGAFDSGTPE